MAQQARPIGIGQTESKGLRKGVVVDIDATVTSIKHAVEEAELMAGCEIHSVYAGISGSHIRSLNSDGTVAIKDKEVSEGDVERVLDAARDLGAGSFARVFRAKARDTGEMVGIKLLRQRYVQDPGSVAEFHREAELGKTLKHPNIVPIYDFAEYEGRPYLVMKHIEGETLKAKLGELTDQEQRKRQARDEFDRALAEYTDTWSFRHPGPADFFRAMEDGAGAKLDWFWRGWIETAARPAPPNRHNMQINKDDCKLSAEFAIPWPSLRYPDAAEDQPWGLNVFRVIRRKNEETLWRAWQREGGGFTRVSGNTSGLSPNARRYRATCSSVQTPRVTTTPPAATRAWSRAWPSCTRRWSSNAAGPWSASWT